MAGLSCATINRQGLSPRAYISTVSRFSDRRTARLQPKVTVRRVYKQWVLVKNVILVGCRCSVRRVYLKIRVRFGPDQIIPEYVR